MKKMLFCLLICLSPAFAHDKFLIHTIPKCGTHFLENVIKEMTGKSTITSQELPFSSRLDTTEMNKKILRFNLPFNRELAKEISRKRYKLLCIYRDPRDALISLVVYMRSYKGQGQERDFFYVIPEFDDLSFDEQLISVMTSEKKPLNYFSLYFARLNWQLLPFALGVRYENLVGSKGGGDDVQQLKEIMNIAEHINLSLPVKRAREIASTIYHSSGKEMIDGIEFVHGKVGSWKRFMKPVHKEIFKERFGEVLIRLGYEKNNNW